jgi:hypothetical protein
MSSFRVRPRFTQTVDRSLDETRARLLEAIPRHSPMLQVKAFPKFIGVHIKDAHRRFWSPRLFLNLEAVDPETTRIEGIYGPEAEVWSLFLYGYMISGLLGTFAAIFGTAQLIVAQSPWAFYVTAGMALLAGSMYFAAQMGQKLGAWQTYQLHQAFESAAGQPAEVR